MLIEFRVKNFKSLKDEAVLSMVASNDDSHENKLINFDNYKLLKEATIYGANGSGKTTVLQALFFMKRFVMDSGNMILGDKIYITPHKLAMNENSNFEIQFIINKIRYAYGFELNKDQVVNEFLYYFPQGGRQNKIFTRVGETVTLGTPFVKALNISKTVLKPYKLFLSCSSNFGDDKYEETKLVKDAFLFFREKLVIHNTVIDDPWLYQSIKVLKQDEEMKRKFISLMQGLGSDFKDLKLIDNDIPQVILKYKDFDLSLNDESNGIQKLFNILCPIIDIIKNDKILLYDEIETSLHEGIVLEIIKLFLNSNTNAQLICTTHNTNLLDLSLLRRDQIWFTELKPEDRSTVLYSLADINNVRKNENIKKGYINGKYGAIPSINSEILNNF